MSNAAWCERTHGNSRKPQFFHVPTWVYASLGNSTEDPKKVRFPHRGSMSLTTFKSFKSLHTFSFTNFSQLWKHLHNCICTLIKTEGRVKENRKLSLRQRKTLCCNKIRPERSNCCSTLRMKHKNEEFLKFSWKLDFSEQILCSDITIYPPFVLTGHLINNSSVDL